MQKDLQPMLSLYSNLMNEVKWRTHAVQTLNEQMDKALNTVQSFIAFEFHWLQLRMICETIALACMVVHGDIEGANSGKIRKEYKPKFLLDGLEKLHPEFYPRPYGALGYNPDGSVVFANEKTSGFLTKDALIKLWGKAGDVLHRGRPADLEINRNAAVKGRFKEIGTAGSEIVELLSLHTIALLGSDSIIACDMVGEPKTTFYTVAPGFNGRSGKAP